MAFNDLTAAAQEGLNYAANQIKDAAGNPVYATGRAYMDFIGESNGMEWLGKKLAIKRAARLAKLEAPANAAVAATVDALPDVP